MKPLLSILIPTLVGRERFFDSLMADFERHRTDEVEILPLKDDRKMSIGEKRNRLLQMATGRFSAFVDDDDKVHENYIPIICEAIKQHPDVDVMGIRGKYFENHRFRRDFVHSLECWDYLNDSRTYFRPPNHLNPIRTDLARQIEFKPISMGEDTDWAMRMHRSGLLQREYMIEPFLYHYYFISRKFY